MSEYGTIGCATAPLTVRLTFLDLRLLNFLLDHLFVWFEYLLLNFMFLSTLLQVLIIFVDRIFTSFYCGTSLRFDFIIRIQLLSLAQILIILVIDSYCGINCLLLLNCPSKVHRRNQSFVDLRMPSLYWCDSICLDSYVLVLLFILLVRPCLTYQLTIQLADFDICTQVIPSRACTEPNS